MKPHPWQAPARRLAWVAASLLSGCPLGGGPATPIIEQDLSGPAEVFEGDTFTLSARASQCNGYWVEKSWSDNRDSVIVASSEPGSCGPVSLTQGPVDYAVDHDAYWWVAFSNGDGVSPASLAYTRSYRIAHIVRRTGIDGGPLDAGTGAGGSASFAVQAHGDDLTYQWLRRDAGGDTFLSGETGATLTLSGVSQADDGAEFSVWVTGRNGTAFSEPARLTVSAALPVVFHDEDFADADWAVETLAVGTGGTASATHGVDDGNPGSRRLLTVWVNGAGADAPSALYMLNWRQDAVYAPAMSGAILSIDYREDQRGHAGSAEQSSALIARQAGQLFYAAPDATTETVWTTKSHGALRAADFVPLGGDPERRIDWSAGGGPIEFGFLRANNVGAGGTQLVTSGDIDNWSVTVWR